MSKNEIENLDIKLISLEEAISYPPLKKQNFGNACTITVDSFNYESVSEKIKENEKLTNLEGAKIDLILEVLKILNDHKIKYNVELHNVIGLHFRGLPLLIINIINDKVNNENTMIYLSLKVYKDELTQRITDKKFSKILAGTVGGIVLFVGGMVGYKLLSGE